MHLVDARTGTRLRTFEGHVGPAYAVAFHPTEPRLATGGEDSVIRIWDTETGSLRLEIREHEVYVRWLEFSPDGTMLASASGDSTVRLWDTLTREQRRLAGSKGDAAWIRPAP